MTGGLSEVLTLININLEEYLKQTRSYHTNMPNGGKASSEDRHFYIKNETKSLKSTIMTLVELFIGLFQGEIELKNKKVDIEDVKTLETFRDELFKLKTYNSIKKKFDSTLSFYTRKLSKLELPFEYRYYREMTEKKKHEMYMEKLQTGYLQTKSTIDQSQNLQRNLLNPYYSTQFSR